MRQILDAGELMLYLFIIVFAGRYAHKRYKKKRLWIPEKEMTNFQEIHRKLTTRDIIHPHIEEAQHGDNSDIVYDEVPRR